VTGNARGVRDSVRVGCIGAGNFARGTIFPNLRKIHGVVMEAVATASGIAAESSRRSDGFRCACSTVELLADDSIDAAFVLSRHDSHARYVLEALKKQKPVFVEKPLCVVREELDSIRSLYMQQCAHDKAPFLMVGFNRRFAPQTEKLREFFLGRREPMLIHIRVNAGYIPLDHWAQRATGGRVVGELCHFVDWARSVVQQPIGSVSASALPDGNRYNRDNLSVTLSFADGSIANLLYLANGDKAIPKEYFEVFCGGAVARLDDFRKLEVVCAGKKQRFKSTQDKGHRKELELTIASILNGKPSPIDFSEICEVTDATFQVEEVLMSAKHPGAPVLREHEVHTDRGLDSMFLHD
jgi:predicted dehydrogenase